jgi:hypothetical protein
MNPSQPSGVLGSAVTFALLLTATGFWFAASGFARFTPRTGETLSMVALGMTVAAVVLFGLTVRSVLFGATSGKRDIKRYSG